MAGHSQFKNVMYRKEVQDAKRSRIFNKIAREITIAARLGGPDPTINPRLRAAIQSGRAQNMPRARIDKAIHCHTSDTIWRDEEVWYEGYGPGGIALIIDVLTNNRNRTAAAIRSAFNKYGGTLGESNSVRFLFQRVGWIVYPLGDNNENTIMETALIVEAQDVEITKTTYAIITTIENFNASYLTLEQHLGEPYLARLKWHPIMTTSPSPESVTALHLLFDVLNDNEDVQHVDSTLHSSMLL